MNAPGTHHREPRSLTVQEWRQLFEGTPGRFVVARAEPPDYPVVAVSDEWLNASGRDRDSVIGSGLDEVIARGPGHSDELRASLTRVFESRSADRMAIHAVPARDGDTPAWWRSTLTPLFVSGGRLAFVVLTQEDVSARVVDGRLPDDSTARSDAIGASRDRQLRAAHEQVTRSNRELERVVRNNRQLVEFHSRFLAALSHEFREPVQRILGPIGTLLDAEDAASTRRSALEEVRRHAGVLQRHVDDLLDASQLDTCSLDIDYTMVDASAIVRSVLDAFEPVARACGVDCVCDLPVVVKVDCDPTGLARIVQSLVSNAIRRQPSGGTLSVRVVDRGVDLELEVADEGPTPSPDQLDDPFVPFLPGPSSGEVPGVTSSLELVIARELIELHGGSIRAEPIAEGGLRFRVSLPVQAPPNATVRASSDPAERWTAGARHAASNVFADRRRPAAAAVATDPTRVLVVSDQPDLTSFVADSLDGRHTVLTASNGEAGFAAALRERPDLIVVDLHDTRIDSERFVRELRASAETAAIPMIVTTSVADDEARVRLLRAHALDVLCRPFLIDELAVRVDKLLASVRAQRGLVASEERYRTLVEHASDGVCVIDPDGRLVEVNRAFCAMLATEPGDLLGVDVETLLVEDDRARCEAERRQLRGEEQIVTEWRLLRTDGSTLPVEVGAKRLPDGRVEGIVRDISERKRVEQIREELLERTAGELSEQQLQLQSIIDTAQDGIVTIDRHGRIELFNPAAERMFGYSQTEVVGRNVKLLMPAETAVEHDGYIERFQRTGEARIIGTGREVVGRRKDGSEFPVELRVGPYDDGRFSGFLRDLSHRKRLEAEYLQAQKLEAVGRLAGGVAHDFNNLLAGLQSGLRIAARTLEPGHPATAMIGEVQNEVERGAAITRRLLDFSRVDRSARRPIDPRDIVRGSEPMLRRLLAEDIDVRIECDDDEWRIEAEPGTLEQILINLVINARDAMPRGGRLCIRCRCVDLPPDVVSIRNPPRRPGRYAILEIEDSGTGMDATTLHRATEPFFTTKAIGLGTGLGLSTVSTIAEGWGGFIELESEPGRGTTARVLLPLCESSSLPTEPAAPTSASGAAESDPAVDSRPATILVVEDEKLVRRGIQHVLEGFGHRVVTASHAAEALELIRELPGSIDLLLTDVVLPGMSGPELVVAAREIRPALRWLYMSAFPQADLVSSGRIEQDAAVLEKPFVQSDVARKVNAALQAEPSGHAGG